jgi:hypothetical protein
VAISLQVTIDPNKIKGSQVQIQPSGRVHRYMEGDAATQVWPSLLEFLVVRQARAREILDK